METTTDTEVTYPHEPLHGTKRIWKTFWILLIITIVELALGYISHMPGIVEWLDLFMKGMIVILTLAKAFYIISIFMHLGDEIRTMILSVALPMLLFIWFISAFLMEGNAIRAARNRYDKNFYEMHRNAEPINKPLKAGDTTTHPLQ